jgi:DNA/RNA-binding domain of Phe-tRNA-synthetase-like protein
VDGRHLIDVAVDPSVAADFPGYRALIVVAEGVGNGPSDAASEELLREAETARPDLERAADHPNVAAWRAAFSAFGAKPSRYPSSVEALLSRALKGDGLPRINRLVDLYNAISVRHVVPVGGEDLDCIVPPMRLVRSAGDESFDAREGEAIEHPRPGEIVWRDARGVTCRRWNWRQGRRTALGEGTTRALFVFDRLEPMGLDALRAAADELAEHLGAWWPGCAVERALLPDLQPFRS